ETSITQQTTVQPQFQCVCTPRCSSSRLKSCFLSSVPVFSWLRRYSLRDWAAGDLVSGISVGIMHLPQGMAYALLAAVPPVYGLFSSFYPILVYFVFGTSQHISVGTYAVMSVMIGAVTERLAPDSDCVNGTSWAAEANVSCVEARVKVAAAVTCLCGLFQLALGLVRFGFVVTYLSEPLVRGYTTAAAINVIVSQLKYTFGIQPQRFSGPFSLIYTVIDLCYLLPKANIGTLVVSIVTIVLLIIAKEVNVLLVRKLPVPIPMELIAIIIATVISSQFNLEAQYGVEVVGDIPTGLQRPVLPDVSLFGKVIGDAIALAVVGYGIGISLGRIFALKYGYRVDSNQELVAFGLSNAIGGVFQCFAISCSMSRSLVQESTGGKTQVAGAISAMVILVEPGVNELMEGLVSTQAVLAAIIYVNLHGMMKQFWDIPMLWRTNRVDMVVWIATLILTVLFNADMGLVASIAFSMLTVIFRTQLPQYSILGQVQDTDIYKPIDSYKQAKQIPGLVIFRSSATLYFANAEMYSDALEAKVRLLHIYSSIMDRWVENRYALHGKCCTCYIQEEPELPHMNNNLATVEKGYYPDRTLPHHIILDLSPVNFLDTVGVKTLRNIRKDYGEIGVEVVLAGSCVVENLERGGYFNEKVTKACLFTTVHDAALYCRRDAAKTDVSDEVSRACRFLCLNTLAVDRDVAMQRRIYFHSIHFHTLSG
uniref:Solute carrier family 26 member 6 n=1 Tax=Scleropages formosus TaxID=113540 RepID=A0A8C9TG45_SCLFO